MRLTLLSAAALAGSLVSANHSPSNPPGYTCMPTCIDSTVTNKSLSFGRHYAVLNLDMINALVNPIANTSAGTTWLNNTGDWIDAVHAQNPPPLSIYTRIYWETPTKPGLGPDSPFRAVGGGLGTASDPATFLTPTVRSRVNESLNDVVLEKTRYYAGFGNQLEEILRTQKIDTVVMSGIRTSGVIINTAYRLFNLDYHVYVIANNTIETPPNGPAINTVILNDILPKLPLNVITIEQAMAALNRSGPAIYGLHGN